MSRVQLIFAPGAAWDRYSAGGDLSPLSVPAAEIRRTDDVLWVDRASNLVLFRETGCYLNRRGTRVLIEDERDSEELDPPVSLEPVMRRVGEGTPTRPRTYEGQLASRILRAVEREVKSPTPLVRTEGRRLIKKGFSRDARQRAAVIRMCRGVCVGCDIDYVAAYGPSGWRVFDRAHIVPLATRASMGPVTTRLSDLVALCPTCHRLLDRGIVEWAALLGQRRS